MQLRWGGAFIIPVLFFKKNDCNHCLTPLNHDSTIIINGIVTSYMKILHSVRSNDNHQWSAAVSQLHFSTFLAKRTVPA
jgi:hypothetical protein